MHAFWLKRAADITDVFWLVPQVQQLLGFLTRAMGRSPQVTQAASITHGGTAALCKACRAALLGGDAQDFLLPSCKRE